MKLCRGRRKAGSWLRRGAAVSVVENARCSEVGSAKSKDVEKCVVKRETEERKIVPPRKIRESVDGNSRLNVLNFVTKIPEKRYENSATTRFEMARVGSRK